MNIENVKIVKSADISACEKYRYTLWRIWDKDKPYVMFIGLNPSTADEKQDDPTVRRCAAFARLWGYGGLCIVNLFAYRATKPKDMMMAYNPVGPNNDFVLNSLSHRAAKIIVAWGTKGNFMDRDREVLNFLGEVFCLEKTKKGFPKHPLYIPSKTYPVSYRLG